MDDRLWNEIAAQLELPNVAQPEAPGNAFATENRKKEDRLDQGFTAGKTQEKNDSTLPGGAPSAAGAASLSLVLVGPDEQRRNIAAESFAASGMIQRHDGLPYPASLDDVPLLAARGFDIVAVDLDSDREFALELVARLCAHSQASVMVFTEQADPELLVRCMWAGAREFLTLPVAPSTMIEALRRALDRRPSQRAAQKAPGKLLVFTGAKGGSGVTTLACNFAAALARASAQPTLLIDLDLPLGDAAISLGLRPDHSTVNALQDYGRLDTTMLSSLIVQHDTGLSVLAAPGQFGQTEVSDEAIEKLLTVARQSFDYVVVDAGSRPDLKAAAVFKEAATIYLVVQVGIAELRNANRIVMRFFITSGPRLQIVLNQYPANLFGIDQEQIAKALTKPVQWKIPSDVGTLQRVKNASAQLAPANSAIARAIDKMARNACGAPAEAKKKSWLSRSR
jgi:pilus assembly protein CpaE